MRIARALENVPPTIGVEKDEEGYPVDLSAAHADVDTGDEPRAGASASDGAEIDG